jgi:hypothetical protein
LPIQAQAVKHKENEKKTHTYLLEDAIIGNKAAKYGAKKTHEKIADEPR